MARVIVTAPGSPILIPYQTLDGDRHYIKFGWDDKGEPKRGVIADCMANKITTWNWK